MRASPPDEPWAWWEPLLLALLVGTLAAWVGLLGWVVVWMIEWA